MVRDASTHAEAGDADLRRAEPTKLGDALPQVGQGVVALQCHELLGNLRGIAAPETVEQVDHVQSLARVEPGERFVEEE